MLKDDGIEGAESSFCRSSSDETESYSYDSRKSDNSALDSICDHIKDIGQTDGQPNELPLFNVNTG